MRLAGLSQAEADAGVAQLLTAVKLDPDYARRHARPDQRRRKTAGRHRPRFCLSSRVAAFRRSGFGARRIGGRLHLEFAQRMQGVRQSSYLFISHDLAVVSYLADEIAVIYLGHLMRWGARRMFWNLLTILTRRPCCRRFRWSTRSAEEHIRLEGDIPSAVDIPTGCRFTPAARAFGATSAPTKRPPGKPTWTAIAFIVTSHWQNYGRCRNAPFNWRGRPMLRYLLRRLGFLLFERSF